ncbi:ATP-binding protein [Dechloromonas sp. ZY10]|uniref:ATP-binding protein n=1 Tax=Dechloromonas aquae TaxID=2664436 RepID=UPI0035295A49
MADDGGRELGVARALTWRYIIALVLVASLSTAAWFSLHLVIESQQSTAAVVNVSGRQRMLSQRTALFANLLVAAPPEQRPALRTRLQEAADLMARSHHGLTHGDRALGLPAGMSATVRHLYFAPDQGLDSLVQSYLAAVDELLRLPDSALQADHVLLQFITELAPNQLLRQLDGAVRQYQREGEAAIAELQQAETAFWLLTLFLLLLEALLIFHPFIRHVRSVIGRLQATSQELVQHQTRLHQMIEERTRELAESEEKFRLITTSAQDPMLMIDASGLLTFWNPAASDVFGYAAEEVLGREMHLLLAPQEQLAAARRGLAHFAESGNGPLLGRTFESLARRKNGEVFPIELSVSTVSLGGRRQALGIVRDISGRKEAEAELARYREHLETLVAARTADLSVAKEQAESASRAKTTFLANMSHELRTPMNAIMGLTGIALRRTEDPALREQLGKIDRASQHLLGVINDILDLTKIEAEHLRLEQRPFALDELCDSVCGLVAGRAADKQLQLRQELAPELRGCWLLGDPFRLEQILINLLGNAIKFTERGVVSLRVEPLGPAQGQRWPLRFSVSDTGIGITPEDAGRLFSAFEQADGSMTRKYGGTGLGLAICKRLVGLMGGEIDFSSQPGVGSVFHFTVDLPIEASPADCTGMLSEPVADEHRLRELAVGRRLLLVEDEPINREVASCLLTDYGFAVDCAGDGEEAVRMAGQQCYDLILMDMQMPRLNGLDATRAIRCLSGQAATPIIALTANAFAEDRETCLAAGMNDHIGKPVQPQQMTRILLKWLPATAGVAGLR